jgi:FkbM family methyltransferase
MRFTSAFRPEYIYHPRRIIGRLLNEAVKVPRLYTTTWGQPIHCDPNESIGRSIAALGVYDLALSEAIFRLLDEGDTALDVGANIGHMTGLMAIKCGPNGRVFSFEPEPCISAALRENITRWKGLAPITINAFALSDHDGTMDLYVPADFATNGGVCTLEPHGGVIHTVDVKRLDGIGVEPIALLKIDVEGHEPAVLRGARELLHAGTIRDVLFEEHRAFPAESHRLLENCGYRVFMVASRFIGPILRRPDWRHSKTQPNNYLATRAPERALLRFRPPGWRVL